MSVFGQVWLWSLAAFVLGVLLTWLLLVRPAQSRVRTLERQLVESSSEPVAAPAAHSAPAGPATHSNFEPPAEPATASEFDDFELDGRIDEQYAVAEATAVREPQDATTELFEPTNPDPGDLPPVEGRTRVDLAPAVPSDTGEGIGSRLNPETSEPTDPGGTAPEGAAPERSESAPSRGLFQPASPSTPPQYAPENGLAPPEPPEPPSEEPVGLESPGAEPDTGDPAGDGVLPKRERKESPRGGFDPPEPIQPSMRAMTRREPVRDDRHSGSLFDPGMPSGAEAELERQTATTSHATDDGAASDAPVGPFGSGSAMPLPGGGRPSEEFAVKASVTTLRYCPPESTKFPEMVAEVWFRTAQDAERVGFRPIG